MSTHRRPTSARAAIDSILRAIFIVPESQVKVLDFAYQFYAFEVFHRCRLNRWSHSVGIPLSLAATYILLSPIPHVPELALAIIASLQIAICWRAGMRTLLPAVVAVHATLYWVALHVLGHVITFGAEWWRHPAVHVVGWPAIQYLTHTFEANVPPPMSWGDGWRPLTTVLRTASPKHFLTYVVMSPLHVGVELVSSHRNFFVLIVLVAERLGYRPEPLRRLRAWIDEECAKPQPVIAYGDFSRAWSTAVATA
jgi:uncharacterized membrane protein YGL010W